MQATTPMFTTACTSPALDCNVAWCMLHVARRCAPCNAVHVGKRRRTAQGRFVYGRLWFRIGCMFLYACAMCRDVWVGESVGFYQANFDFVALFVDVPSVLRKMGYLY